MSKKNQTTLDHDDQHRINKQDNAIEQAGQQSTVVQSPQTYSTVGSNPNIQSQASQLGNARIQMAQRQMMASRMAHTHGNSHMMQVMRMVNKNRGNPQMKHTVSPASSKTNNTTETSEATGSELETTANGQTPNTSFTAPPPANNNNTIQTKPNTEQTEAEMEENAEMVAAGTPTSAAAPPPADENEPTASPTQADIDTAQVEQTNSNTQVEATEVPAQAETDKESESKQTEQNQQTEQTAKAKEAEAVAENQAERVLDNADVEPKTIDVEDNETTPSLEIETAQIVEDPTETTPDSEEETPEITLPEETTDLEETDTLETETENLEINEQTEGEGSVPPVDIESIESLLELVENLNQAEGELAAEGDEKVNQLSGEETIDAETIDVDAVEQREAITPAPDEVEGTADGNEGTIENVDSQIDPEAMPASVGDVDNTTIEDKMVEMPQETAEAESPRLEDIESMLGVGEIMAAPGDISATNSPKIASTEAVGDIETPDAESAAAQADTPEAELDSNDTPIARMGLNSGMLQAKLEVNAPNDIYEQEADQMADTVMSMPDNEMGVQRCTACEEELVQTKAISGVNGATPIQRLCPACEAAQEEETSVQRCAACEEELVQTKAISDVNGASPIQRLCPACEAAQEEENIQTKTNTTLQASSEQPTEAGANVENNINQMQGSGQPLPEKERNFFESRMGHDFSDVRIQTSSKAAETAQNINARAFTVGNDIYFNQGEYKPGNNEGRHLLAHELTHTVQQNGGSVQAKRIQRNVLTDAARAAAEAVLNKVKGKASSEQGSVDSDANSKGSEVDQDKNTKGNELQSEADAKAPELQSEGETQGEQLQTEADTQSEQLQTEADSEGEALQSEGETKGEELQTEADTGSEELQSEADTQSEQLQTDADAQSEELQSEADTKSEELQTEAETQSEELQGEAEGKGQELETEAANTGSELESDWTGLETGAESKATEVQTQVEGEVGQLEAESANFVQAADSNWQTLESFAMEQMKTLDAAAGDLCANYEQKIDALIEQAKTMGRAALNYVKQGWNDLQAELSTAWAGFKSEYIDPVLDVVNEKWETFQAWATPIWEGIKEKATQIVNWANEKINQAWDWVQEKWNLLSEKATQAWNLLKEKATQAWNYLKDKATEAWNTLKSKATEAWNTLKQKATEAWNTLKQKATEAWNTLKAKASELWNTLKSKASEAWNALKGKATEAWNALKGKVTEAWSTLKGKASEAWNALKGKASEAWNTLKGKTSEAWNWLKDKGTNFVNAVKDNAGRIISVIMGIASPIMWIFGGIINTIVNNLKGVIDRAANALMERVTQAWGFVKEKGTAAWNFVKEKGTAAWNFLKDKGTTAWNFVKEKGTTAWNFVKEKGTTAWNFVKEKGTTAWNFLKEKGTTAWNFVKEKGAQAWNFVKEKGTAAWNFVKEKGSAAWNWVKDKGTAAWGWLKGIGEAVVQNLQMLWDGVKMVWAALQPKLIEAFDWIKERVSQGIDWILENTIGAAWNWITSKWEALKGWFVQNIPGLSECLALLANKIPEIAVGICDDVGASMVQGVMPDAPCGNGKTKATFNAGIAATLGIPVKIGADQIITFEQEGEGGDVTVKITDKASVGVSTGVGATGSVTVGGSEVGVGAEAEAGAAIKASATESYTFDPDTPGAMCSMMGILGLEALETTLGTVVPAGLADWANDAVTQNLADSNGGVTVNDEENTVGAEAEASATAFAGEASHETGENGEDNVSVDKDTGASVGVSGSASIEYNLDSGDVTTEAKAKVEANVLGALGAEANASIKHTDTADGSTTEVTIGAGVTYTSGTNTFSASPSTKFTYGSEAGGLTGVDISIELSRGSNPLSAYSEEATAAEISALVAQMGLDLSDEQATGLAKGLKFEGTDTVTITLTVNDTAQLAAYTDDIAANGASAIPGVIAHATMNHDQGTMVQKSEDVYGIGFQGEVSAGAKGEIAANVGYTTEVENEILSWEEDENSPLGYNIVSGPCAELMK